MSVERTSIDSAHRPVWHPLYPLATTTSGHRRALAFPLTRLTLALAIFIAIEVPFAAAHVLWGTWIGSSLLNCGAALIAVVAVTRWIEHRPVASAGLGTRQAPREAVMGAGLGTAACGLVVAAMALAGWYHPRSVHPGHLPAVLGMLVVFVAAASFEELMYRATMFRLLEEWLGTWAALILPAALFGLAHADNPHATVISTLTTVSAAVWVSLLFVRTRQAWLPIGAHVAWNFVQNSVFGMPVSGDLRGSVLLKAHVTGATAWGGGPYGIEGSWLTLFVIVPQIGWLVWSTRAAGRAIAPSWRRRENPSAANAADIAAVGPGPA